ncbi:chromatin remodeling complex Adenosinetriphosphatase, partial [Elasticomyces elasticus]
MAQIHNHEESETSSVADTSMTDAPPPRRPHRPSFGHLNNTYNDTPDFTDTESGPNTSASSANGEAMDKRRKKNEALLLRKSILGKQQGQLNENKEDDTIRRFKYLLGLTDLFRHFIETNPNPRIREVVQEIDRQNEAEAEDAKKAHKRAGGAAVKGRKTEQEEDAELLRDEKRGAATQTMFRDSPSFVQNGEMRDYQVQGLNWLVSLHENGISGILADEMGLGKTLQTISFLGYLLHICDITGPNIVAVPNSTLDNWAREFKKWTPEVD